MGNLRDVGRGHLAGRLPVINLNYNSNSPLFLCPPPTIGLSTLNTLPCQDQPTQGNTRGRHAAKSKLHFATNPLSDPG